MDVNPINSSVYFQPSDYPVLSDWSVHIPFGMYLVDLLRPNLIVELGTTNGVSFFSFCQTISLLNLSTRCFGVAAWNEKSSREKILRHCEENFRPFAEIIEKDPKTVTQDFEDASIDLLHLSGVFSFEEAAQLIEVWLPKLSQKSAILLDHINEEKGQTNFELWCSLKGKYPTFEILHSGGLGLALVGHQLPQQVVSIASLNPEAFTSLQSFFFRLGLQTDQLLQDRNRILTLQNELDEYRYQFIDRSQELMRKEFELREIYASKAWMVGKTLRNFRVKVLPPESRLFTVVGLLKKVIWVWKYEGPSSVFRAAKRRVRSIAVKSPLVRTLESGPVLSPNFQTPNFDLWYQNWIQDNEPKPLELEYQREAAKGLKFRPKISILVPIYNPPPGLLEEMINAVLCQTYDQWEVCLAVGGAVTEEVKTNLERYAKLDGRIRCLYLEKNLGISGNTNAALEMASGDYVHLLDQDDLIPPFALYEIVNFLNSHPECEVIYSDEDRISVDGKRSMPFFKPDWSPDLLQAFMYIGHATYKKDLVQSLGGFRPEFDFSQDYDLALRASEQVKCFGHVQKVLYHWRTIPQSAAAGGKNFARQSNLAALADAVNRRGYDAEVVELPSSNCVKYHVREHPLVSIIIPTDDEENANKSLKSILGKTSYKNFEILLVINSRTGALVKQQFENDERVRIIAFDRQYNFSAKCNEGVKEARGEYVLFMNDDVYPTNDDWLEWMVGPFQQEEVGAVAPKLLYTNGTVQHAGLVSGVRNFYGTAFHTFYQDSGFYFNLLQSPRTVSALSAACMIMRKSVFEQVGRFDDIHTPIMHSDLDLCYKIRDAGLRLVYTPYAVLEHVGHQSLGKAEAKGIKHSHKADMFMLKRWTKYVDYDPYYPTHMRDMIYIDSPEKIRAYLGDQSAYLHCKKDVLILSHEMTFSGAPLMAYQQARHLRDAGYFVTVGSPSDGALAERFKENNIPLVIDPLISSNPERLGLFIRDYDLIVVNTITAWRLVLYAKSLSKKVVWLIHESNYGCQEADANPLIREALAKADRVIFPSEQTLAKYKRFDFANNFAAFPFGIELSGEIVSVHMPKSGQQLRVVHVGSVEARKGQDILVQAIELLPQPVRDRFDFYFVGRVLYPDYYQDQLKKTSSYPNVHWVGQVTPDRALGYIAASDLLICSSRDETGPLVVFEAMGLGKTIVSTPVGVVPEVIEHGKNGYIFPSQDAKELSQVLIDLDKNRSALNAVGQAAEKTFKEKLNSQSFVRALLQNFPPLD